ncbi:MAG: HAMP domain-containing protein, partial [Bacteroidia bacterium]|nr:HAMP domain-containing protein [Bacteroidia bacterium]
MNISIKKRIHWSFSLLVFLFLINSVVSIVTLKSDKKLATDLFLVIAPSIQTLDDFNKMMIESKMNTTNWVFLRYNTEDKRLLKKLHDSDYIELKSRLNEYSSQWVGKNWIDSVNKIYTGFEELLAIEKKIMGSLKEFKDYDDPVIKLEAERTIEEDVLPRTASLMNSLKTVYSFVVSNKNKVANDLEISSTKLRTLIIILIISIVMAGFFLSVYLTKIIIGPVNRIREIINNLGRGIIQKIDHPANGDEIGKMVQSVNNLSEKLLTTATFAHETGLRNFDMPYRPLSDEDTLGKALLSMRENLKTGEANLAMQNKELEQKNKELEQFAYVASHDLQEPLRTTTSFVDLLQKQYKGKLDDNADKYLQYISQSADRMK